ncbi:MAG TPA: hypothetical protein VNT75_11025, partial [Symbiobacteriaceae bacterium]|nr:hypothetical protein [Symbiobacteriaceae bacterium]
ADLSRLPAGRYTLALTPSAQEMDVQILPYSTGYTAALGALLLLLGLPGALIPTSPLRIKGGGKVGGWLYLVVDSQGMSLPRVLLIIFFVPCAIVYMTLAFALHEFPNLPDSIWQLLGFGGAGAALGAMLEPGKKPGNGDAPPQDPGGQTAAAPPEVKQAMDEVAASAQPAPVPTQPSPPAVPDVVTIKRPEFSDLFRDPNGFGDISHFQTLVISLATAIVFLFSFFDDWVVPDIPTPVLQLLGTSLGVYLGVKGVKLFKQS